MDQCTDLVSVLDAQRWGLPAEAVASVAQRLRSLWSRFRHCFRTKTRDGASHAWTYLRGLLTMTHQRNYANIARRVVGVHDDGQNLQQFMSDSPWDDQAVFVQIQAEIRQRPALHGGMLTLDDSGDHRTGEYSAGTDRQYLGRWGMVSMGQVGVALGYYQEGLWAMVDAALYLPALWFDEAHRDLRQRWHVPEKATFLSKGQLGWQMIQRAQAQGLPFALIGCDSWYGQDFDFRLRMDDAELHYMAHILPQMRVYLSKPLWGIPPSVPGRAGRRARKPRLLNPEQAVAVRTLSTDPAWTLRPVPIRHGERGLITYRCAAGRVWTVKKQQIHQEWLIIHQDAAGKVSYTLSNLPAEATLEQLAQGDSQRYFAERIFQDAKSEAGWDELVARKYRAWVHHSAMDALALWFVAETKWDWAQEHPRDAGLQQELQVAVLPGLSMANVRELLQAAMPLPQLSIEEARNLVIQHLVHRARSTSSRLRAQQRSQSP